MKNIIFLYECIQKSSAHSQHYQTPKACDIDDIVIKNIYYCTYLYALRQYNQNIQHEEDITTTTFLSWK